MSLELHGASVIAGGRPILRDVTVQFAEGQVTAIVGPNGAGKSTLLHVASGLLAPAPGRVLIAGEPVATMPPAKLAQLRAMLPQDSATAARFRLHALVAMGAAVSAPQMPVAERDRLALDLLDRLGLAGFAARDLPGLSGGERQRAHLARVLMQLEAPGGSAPGFLLLDEPLSAQDPAHQAHVLRLARAHARRGGGVVLVMHDLNWAAAVADRLLVMRNGMIHAEGPPDILDANLLAEVFGLPPQALRRHAPSGRPFILPHDMINQGDPACILP